MTSAERAVRAAEADALCARAFAGIDCPESGVALVAVGGYGREELAPYSDLDVVLVYDDHIEPGEWAAQIWYPLWDSGANVDHAVRTVSEVLEQSGADLRVMLGMLDLRHLAGDPNLTLRLRTAVLAAWRREAKQRLPELREMVRSRAGLIGELAHASVPDLKESTGGLRDATVLRALVASWLVDVPHGELESCRQSLLDVRDALQTAAGRATDRVAPEYWPEIAETLGLADAVAAQQHTRALGRRLTHISRLTWRRVDSALRRAAGATGPRRPTLEPIAHGVAISNDEIVLDRSARPEQDPLLLLRAAAEAAERDLVLAPPTAARLGRVAPSLPEPWPDEARDLFVRLLAAGPGLLAVWETLDETGAIEALLPEWDSVRLLPHASVVHRFTVDRHMVETCIAASALIRRVARPDVLMVAALVHDIGKGGTIDHCIVGEPIARRIAARMGFDDREVDLVAALVRRHLLLPETATTRDPEDPATIQLVVDQVGDREELELLAALTEADALATSDKAWTSWRAGLIRSLVRRAAAVLAEEPAVEPPVKDVEVSKAEARLLAGGGAIVRVEEVEDGALVRVLAADRVGLLADAAAMLAVGRVSVRGARSWTQEYAGRRPLTLGVSEWSVDEMGLDAAVLRQRLDAIRGGRLDVAQRLTRPARTRLEPTVAVRPDGSRTATVLEVRAADRPGLIYTVASALAGLDVSVRSAHVTTLGPQAVDFFYVHEASAGALTEERAARAVDVVRSALEATVEGD